MWINVGKGGSDRRWKVGWMFQCWFGRNWLT
jgi:hypothetical protein